MSTVYTGQQELTVTLRILAHLLDYPNEAFRAELPALQQALHAHAELSEERLAEIDVLVQGLVECEGLESESAYVELFDRGRGTALHLFEHVHGDSRERGPAMIDLLKTYEQAGLYLSSNELPDHLTVFVEYTSTQPSHAAKNLLAEIAHLLRKLYSALERRQSAYAAVLASLLEIAGESVHPTEVADEPSLDDTWAEPAAFEGCSSSGQKRPVESQPITVFRNARPRVPTHDEQGRIA